MAIYYVLHRTHTLLTQKLTQSIIKGVDLDKYFTKGMNNPIYNAVQVTRDLATSLTKSTTCIVAQMHVKYHKSCLENVSTYKQLIVQVANNFAAIFIHYSVTKTYNQINKIIYIVYFFQKCICVNMHSLAKSAGMNCFLYSLMCQIFSTTGAKEEKEKDMLSIDGTCEYQLAMQL